jgi:hypothetical protein
VSQTPELDAFKRELAEAGQPWSRRGARTIGVGVVGLLVVQLSPSAGKATLWLTDIAPGAFYVLAGLAVALILAGWGMLVAAFVKRRRWVKAQNLAVPALTDPRFPAP